LEDPGVDGRIQLQWMGRACSTDGDRLGAYRFLMVKPDGSKKFGRPRRRWDDKIIKDLGEVSGGRGAGTRSIWLRIGTGGGLL
jgi:hypothetical protein